MWDWNGTLVDDLPLVIAATNAAFASVGGPEITAAEHRRGFRRPIVDYYAEVLGRPVDEDEFNHLNKVFHDEYQAGLASCRLTADAEPALRAWPESQSLLSMWYHEELLPTVIQFGLSHHFIRVDGLRRGASSSATGQKVGLGHKAPYLADHLAGLSLDGDGVVLVGDTVDDAEAAAAAGAACVLYTGGFTDRELLLTTGAPVVDSLVEAVRLAQKI